MSILSIRIEDRVKEKFPEIALAYTIVEGVQVKATEPEKVLFMRKIEEEMRSKYNIDELKGNPLIRAYRDFYWRIEIDPTKQRPSSEALLRRVLRGRKLPLINNVVDAGNLASLKTLIPIGLYDLDKLLPPLVLRFAKEGEVFQPIGGKTEVLTENQIVLADAEKIVHIFPHRDSIQTCIRENTRNVLVVACGVPKVPSNLLKEAAKITSKYIVMFAGGKFGEVLLVT